ncbi:type 2 periplasmic-binding domain-containing protein [Mycobacterium kiyosense]|nr:hypothetical protein IWGMT90018_28930 [Mycobacterium kiyosense]
MSWPTVTARFLNALLTALEAGLLAQEGIALEVLSGAQGALHFTYDHPAYTRFGGEIPPLVKQGLRAPGRTRLLGVTRFAGLRAFTCARTVRRGRPPSWRRVRVPGGGDSYLAPRVATASSARGGRH